MKLRAIMLGAAASALTLSAAQAADLLSSPPPSVPYESGSLFDFEGLYFGGTLGGALWGGTALTTGVVVGANFAITDGIIGGLEFQGDLYWAGGGIAAYDALAMGKLGGFLAENTMIFGELGGGVVNSTPVYALGTGVEIGMTDNLAFRGELQGIGAWGTFPSIGKATVGLVWHIN